MNINQNINKLLFALQKKGLLYRINSFRFWSDRANKYSTKYLIYKRTCEDLYNTETDEIETKERYTYDYECYGKVELLKYLIDEYKKIGSEADGE